MKKWIIGLAAAGVTVALTVYAIKKVNEALEGFYLDDTEEDVKEDAEGLPEGVEGFDPTAWYPNLPEPIQKVVDEALARFPEGWSRRIRPSRTTETEEPAWDRVQADQAQG